MAVATDVVARRYINITAGTPIDVDYPVYEDTDVRVIYGKLALVAVLNVDYTVTLDAPNFDTFIVTPTAALLTKINDLIAQDPEEINYIVVRRVMDFLTDTTPSAVRYTPFTSREFDRTALRFQQLQETVNRSILLGENFVGDTPSLQITELLPGRTLIVDDTGTSIVAGPSSDEIENAQQYAENAGAAAAAAAASETNAINAAAAAAGSASDAGTAASAAEAAATAASGAADDAEAAASAAAGSAGAAATSATNAGNSASAAAGSATTAGTAAADAGNSATAAAGSATSAGNSATAAAQDAADADAARIAAEAAAAAASGTIFPTRAAAMAATIPPTATHLTIKGWAAAGDGGEATYAIVSTEPTHPGKFVLQGGKWAEIAMRRFEPRMFGAKADYNLSTGAGTNNVTALQNMFDASKAQGGVPMVISGRYRCDNKIYVQNSNCSIRGEWFSGAVIASTVADDYVLTVSQDTYLNGTHIEGLTFIALTLQTAGGAMRIDYSAADSLDNRGNVRCLVNGVSAYPRDIATTGWKNGLTLGNVHNATIQEFNALGGRNFSLPQADPNHWTHMDAGIRLQASTGFTAVPSDLRIINPRILHSSYGIHVSGEYEGVRIDNPILVAVSVGIYYVMDSVRPWLQVESGHINYMSNGIFMRNAPQSNINNILFYKFQNSSTDSSAINMGGCDHSQIDQLRCYNLCADAAVNGQHIGLVMDSQYCTVGSLIMTNPSTAVMLDGTSTGNRINTPLLQGTYTNSPVRYAVLDTSSGVNEYGSLISANKNAGAVTVTSGYTTILTQGGVSLSKGDRVRVTAIISGSHGATAGVMLVQITSSSGGGGIGYFGLDLGSATSRQHGVAGDWDNTISSVFSCVSSGIFSFNIDGVSTGSDSTVLSGGAQMTIERL